MTVQARRRVRVRDDGSGKQREIDGTLEEFADEDAVVLLGDPGMGKTTLLRVVSKGKASSVRRFLVDPNADTSRPLFLDGLDEFRTAARGVDASSDLAKALVALGKPKFRLSCRAADWFGSSDQEVLRMASASRRVVVVELCPLSDEEIRIAVEGIVPNTDQFLDEATSAGLGHLLGNPQTLQLIALAWSSQTKPRNKFEAYEIGVAALARETNDQHIVRGATGLSTDELRRAAGAGASVVLLSNSIGLNRTDLGASADYVPFGLVPTSSKDSLDEVVKRRLFISHSIDQFESVHRTVAEFLAAEDLARRISNGLPADRVLALMCAADGQPVSSLRGLFAWLVCRLGPAAPMYIERDPYAVATYGDASVLPPNAQRAIWAGLRKLDDPWFLASDDDRGTFRSLANPSTAAVINSILSDPRAAIHLKIAALEAVCNSSEVAFFGDVSRRIAVEPDDNTWLRTTAAKAFASSVQNRTSDIDNLDAELALASDRGAAIVRITLLQAAENTDGNGPRLLSILEQSTRTNAEEGTFGHFYSLMSFPSDGDLDTLLDGAGQVLTSRARTNYEVRSLFEHWLKRRLSLRRPAKADQLSRWLKGIHVGRDRNGDELAQSLKRQFKLEPKLFDNLFDMLATARPNEERSFWLFVAHDFGELVPPSVWPEAPSVFFLRRAEEEPNTEHAADLIRMSLSWFPKGGSTAFAERVFALIAKRPEIGTHLGDWNASKIEGWRHEQLERSQQEKRERDSTRADNVGYFTPRIAAIRQGTDARSLAWASSAYHGFFYDVEDIPDGRQRLASLTNKEIADAFLEGFLAYITSNDIPTSDEIINSWIANSIPWTHALLALSVVLNKVAGNDIAENIWPSCIAAAVTSVNVGDKIPEYDKTLAEFVVRSARDAPQTVSSVLSKLWILGTQSEKRMLPGLYELRGDPQSKEVLASVAAAVLKSRIRDPYAVRELISVLLDVNPLVALALAKTELGEKPILDEVAAIWIGTILAVEGTTDLRSRLQSMSDAGVWEVIELIGVGPKRPLVAAQRATLIATLGARFPNVGSPRGGWGGSRNPWDAAQFITKHIAQLASDPAPDAASLLAGLVKDRALESYHDFARHQGAQRARKDRDIAFSFGSPDAVSSALKNEAPATASDLLAFVVDHLSLLARELVGTERERYRAYWNESGRTLVKPKREEVCSGLLAEDLQVRISPLGLIVTVEQHMIQDKECDIVVIQGTSRFLPIEAKHHCHSELWTAWRTQLDQLYLRDIKSGGLGIYVVFWSGEAKGRMMPKLPIGITRPSNAPELKEAIQSQIPDAAKSRLRVVVVDISAP